MFFTCGVEKIKGTTKRKPSDPKRLFKLPLLVTHAHHSPQRVDARQQRVWPTPISRRTASWLRAAGPVGFFAPGPRLRDTIAKLLCLYATLRPRFKHNVSTAQRAARTVRKKHDLLPKRFQGRTDNMDTPRCTVPYPFPDKTPSIPGVLPVGACRPMAAPPAAASTRPADVVVVDGTRVKTSGNVSAEYNELFPLLALRVVAVKDWLRSALTATETTMVFWDPGYIPSGLWTATFAALSSPGKRSVVVVIDDVECTSRTAGWTLAMKQDPGCTEVSVRVAAFYPWVLHSLRGGWPAADVPVHRVWHGVSSEWMPSDAGAGKRSSGPRGLLVCGQSYPARVAAAGAVKRAGLPCVVFPDPDYVCASRCAPEELAAKAIAVGNVFVGGATQGAPVAKHFEFAASGKVAVWTDPATAEHLPPLLHCHVWHEEAGTVPVCEPGPLDEANALLVRDNFTVGHLAATLAALLRVPV